MDMTGAGKMLQNPNFFTSIRIFSVPLIVVLLVLPQSRLVCFMAALVFSVASITDYIDGFLARKHGMVSNFGKAMDPLADKLLVCCSFIMLAARGLVPGWIVCVIVARELGITGMRNVLADAGQDISASMLGKYKTTFQIAAIIPLLLHYEYFGINMHVAGTWLLWCAVALTLWSGIDYMIKVKPFLS